MVLGADEDLVQFLGNAVRRKCVRQLLAVFGEREKSNAACVWRADESTVVAEAELLDEAFSLVGLSREVKHSTTVLFDVRSTDIAHRVRYDSCVYAVGPLGKRSSCSLEVGDVAGP